MSAGPYRLRVAADAVPVKFRVDGQTICGVMGDTVASALLANGFRVVSRSFKFHRPRGIFSAGYEEPNALVQLNSGAYSIPCARATLIPIRSGLEVSSGTGWPSVSFDALRAIDFVHHLFAAGFYNKTFIWPSWHRYESIIRKLAGFGRAPTGPDPHRYETRHAHCDVLVIGGGHDGIEAAKAAVRNGRRLILAGHEGLARSELSSLAALENVRVLPNAMAVGFYDHNMVTLAESVPVDSRGPRERLWMVRARGG